MVESESWLEQMLDTCFHLPTLLVGAVAAALLVWQMFGLGFNLGDGFLKVNSSQGSVMIHWDEGCCELNW
ncbi:MAG: hypothetical protein U0401_34245 [Anaerolineae bacterium]